MSPGLSSTIVATKGTTLVNESLVAFRWQGGSGIIRTMEELNRASRSSTRAHVPTILQRLGKGEVLEN